MDNLNPVWNETFTLPLDPTAPSQQVLYITLWDQNTGTHDHSLGQIAVPLQGIIAAPNGTVEASYPSGKASGTLFMKLQYVEDASHSTITQSKADQASREASAAQAAAATTQRSIEAARQAHTESENYARDCTAGAKAQDQRAAAAMDAYRSARKPVTSESESD